MFDKETMKIIEIVKATPDSKSEDDFIMKSYMDLAEEAIQHGVSARELEFGLKRLLDQGLVKVYRSFSGTIRVVAPTFLFRNLFT